MAGPAAVPADTVYFSGPGGNGIESISGTIVQETGSHVEIETADGEIVTIAKDNVFQITRDEKTTAEHLVDDDTPPSLRRSRSHSGRAHHFGVKGGMNFANMSVDPAELQDDDSLKSYAVGAWWGVPVNRRLTIRTEALYSVKGDAETADGYTTSTRMSYLDVPVLAKVGFLHDASARPSLFLGPLVALNLTANSKLEGDGGDLDMDVKDQVRTLDFGLVVGGGVDFTVGEHTYGLELRYARGLGNAVEDAANGTARNDVIAVMGSIGWQ
jgi:hypothetical protein